MPQDCIKEKQSRTNMEGLPEREVSALRRKQTAI